MGDVRVKWPLLILLVAVGLVGVAMVVSAPIVWQGVGRWLRDATGWVEPEHAPDGVSATAIFGGIAQCALGFFAAVFAVFSINDWKVVWHDG